MLIEVVEESLLLLPGPDELSAKTIREQARGTLAKTRDSLAPEARIVIQTGALVWRALESVVCREHRDLLVIGSGHHVEDGEVRLGQSARDLLATLERPLALAPRGMRDRHQPGLERLGVGFDGGPESQTALKLAASIAGAAGAELEVLGVVDDRVPGGLKAARVVLGGGAIADPQVDSLLERALLAVKANDVPARVQVIPGNPSVALRSLATRVDLLVIGSNRSGPAGRLSVGHTGNRVVAGCPCPVMIVPRPRDASAA